MKARCYHPKSADFPNYGGRGIVVCDRWRASFVAFLADMGRRPTPVHQIDRIDNNGPYEPGNCRWATSRQQHNNRRDNHRLTHDGITRTLQEWARITGINRRTIAARLARGWDVSTTFATPVK